MIEFVVIDNQTGQPVDIEFPVHGFAICQDGALYLLDKFWDWYECNLDRLTVEFVCACGDHYDPHPVMQCPVCRMTGDRGRETGDGERLAKLAGFLMELVRDGWEYADGESMADDARAVLRMIGANEE